jgi:hypothetical protein
LLQAFIADKVLEDELFRHADQKRGRFRTFLLTSLNNFVNSYFRKVKRQPLQLSAVEFLPQAKEDPGDTEVEAAWARSLIREVLRAMENECLRIKRRDIWVVFEGRILRQMFQNQEPVSYAALASILKLKSPTQAANLLVTGKRMYSRLLRTAVAEYERDEQAIDDEITVLRRVLSGSAYVV